MTLIRSCRYNYSFSQIPENYKQNLCTYWRIHLSKFQSLWNLNYAHLLYMVKSNINGVYFTPLALLVMAGRTFTKTSPSRYTYSHHKPETIVKPSEVFNGDSYIHKKVSFYWIKAHVTYRISLVDQHVCHWPRAPKYRVSFTQKLLHP